MPMAPQKFRSGALAYRPPLPQRASTPLTWLALARSIGWSEGLARTLWAVAMRSEADPHCKGLMLNYALLDDRVRGLGHDAIVIFLKKNAAPRSLMRTIELAVQLGHVRRASAKKLEEKLLVHVGPNGDWKD